MLWGPKCFIAIKPVFEGLEHPRGKAHWHQISMKYSSGFYRNRTGPNRIGPKLPTTFLNFQANFLSILEWFSTCLGIFEGLEHPRGKSQWLNQNVNKIHNWFLWHLSKEEVLVMLHSNLIIDIIFCKMAWFLQELVVVWLLFCRAPKGSLMSTFEKNLISPCSINYRLES